MLQIGTAQAEKGSRAFGHLTVGHTLSQIPITIPVNLINGAKDGPTLAIGAAVHGPEIIGSVSLGRLLRELDPAELAGQLIVIPVVNTSAFEFGQRETRWDGKDLNRQGRGQPAGSVSQRLAHAYFENVIKQSDYFIDIHSGGPDTYFYYTIVTAQLCHFDHREKSLKRHFYPNVGWKKVNFNLYRSSNAVIQGFLGLWPRNDMTAEQLHTIYLSDAPGLTFAPQVVETSRQMALAFGLEHIFAKTPWRGTFKEEAMKAGVPAIAIEMAGGPDFFHNGQRQIETCLRGITNVMKYLGMLDGEIVVEASRCKLWEAHTELVAGAEAGFMLRQVRWGDYLQVGDTYAIIYHPYTGQELDRVTTPRAGTVLNSGTIWPAIGPGRWLAVLGDLIEEVPLPYKVMGAPEDQG